jgi:large subunit ribosomal protein L21
MPGVKMKYAIVESGGKQYKAVEGETIEVDRLPVNAGEKVGLERVLMVVDGDDISVGTPTVDGVQVSTTVTEHFKGPKIIVFKYSPRKRYRVKGGHRQQYTRLMVDAIGSSGKASKAKKAEAPAEKKAETKAEKKVEKKEAAAAKPAAQKAEKAPAKRAPAKKAPAKKTEKASAKTTTTSSPKAKKAPATSSPKGKKTEKTPAKKTTTKKTTTKKSSSTKKSEK